MNERELRELIENHLQADVFHLVGRVADAMGRECYVVGGYVRDIFLRRHSKDIDFVTVGSGIEVAQAVARAAGRGSHIAVYRNFGTAQVKLRKGVGASNGNEVDNNDGIELEFVGARRESYNRGSRKPIVEDGTLEDDQRRRDFTINAMAICVNSGRYGELLDPFDGMGDMARRIIRTPLDPDITFSDDPLRMMRAVRFATQLEFDIYPETFSAISRNCERISIISGERIADELMKIMSSAHPSRGFKLLKECRLLELIFPELAAMAGVETVNGRGHKDNFWHTMQVLENVAGKSDNVWLRWAALLHDIAKPVTKRYDPNIGWTFHNHNFVGERMVPKIFKRLKLPMDQKMRYVKKLVGLHMRPIALVEEEVTDSAVRRLLFDAGDDIDDLMILCEADITSKNQERVRRYLDNFALVRRKLEELEERDRVRNFQPPVTGEDIMATFALTPCSDVGKIKDAIKDAILDGIIPNRYIPAYLYMIEQGRKLGLTAVKQKSEQELESEEFVDAYQSPLGVWLMVKASHNGLMECRFTDSLAENFAPKQNSITVQAVKELGEYFAGRLKQFTVPLDIRQGTAFQRRVWESLLKIPYGSTISYKQEAELLGNAKAMRAVGAANGKNPIVVIVPCHRVVKSTGEIGGYTGGVALKQKLLDHERRNLQFN